MFGEWRARPVGDEASAEQPVTVPGRPDALAGADGVVYETTVADPRDPDDEVAVLALGGLYAHAEVSVTADRLDGDGPVTHDAYFEPLRIPIRPDGETGLTVTCRAPQDRFGGLYDTNAVPEGDRVPGIWWDAAVETHPLPYIDRLSVDPELTDEGAVLSVRTTVVTDGSLDDRVTYSLKPEGDHATSGMMSRGAVETTTPGRTTVEHTIRVRDPSLWWPRGMGEQHRYRLRAKLGDSERSITTGLCATEREGGRLSINGTPVPIRGVNLRTSDPADVDRAAAVNANLVRAPAHALPPEVYEACDEAGMLVWQGLPLTGPGEFDVDRGQRLAASLARTYGHHPSFAAVGIHDEPTDSFGDALGDGFVDRLRVRWRAWRTDYDRGPAERVADSLPPSCLTFPVVGGPGVDHDAGAYYPGWDYGTAGDVDWLLDRYPTELLGAFGAASLVADRADAAGFDSTKHAARVGDGDEDSQAYQAEVVRTVAGWARRQRLGAVASALRDAGGAGMGVYAADGTPKRARDALAGAFRPVQALLGEPTQGGREIVVVNDRPRPLNGHLAWRAGEVSGEFDVTVDAAGRWSDTVAPGGDAGEIRFELSDGEVTVESSYRLD